MTTMLTPHDAPEWRDAMKGLLPRGAAWQVPEGSAFEGLLHALAEEFARAEARLVQLVEEADPLTTDEMIADWERVTGLPDNCFAVPTGLADRQIAVNQRMVAIGGQSALYFRELASRIGYTVEIVEYRTARINDRIGQRLFTGAWQFTWAVRVITSGPAEFNLECLIERHKPAHTTVYYIYEG